MKYLIKSMNMFIRLLLYEYRFYSSINLNLIERSFNLVNNKTLIRT